MRRTVGCLLAFVALVGCSGGPKNYKLEDLKLLVLQAQEAPARTKFDPVSSGERKIREIGNDSKYQRRLTGAGFVTSQWTVFLAQRREIIAVSYAMLFASEDSAGRAMSIVEEHIRQDGQRLRDIPADGLGEESFAVAGNLEPRLGYPPGFHYIWRRGNAIFGLVAAGPQDTINENAARALAERMEARAD